MTLLLLTGRTQEGAGMFWGRFCEISSVLRLTPRRTELSEIRVMGGPMGDRAWGVNQLEDQSPLYTN